MEKELDRRHDAEFLRTDRGRTKSNAIEVPSIALPKGGGAIKGIDEKFRVNAVNGTASLSFPLPFSHARGTSPSLSISYNSGSGNGVFGLGWDIDLPSIRRKADKELPRYNDAADPAEADVYLFSEAEDLVPAYKKDANGAFLKDRSGRYQADEKDSPDGLYVIRRYMPRVEGTFARVERWTAKDGSEIKWRVISGQNVTTLFGWQPASRISDPHDVTRTFEWLPDITFDDKGHCSRFIYKREDEKGVRKIPLHNRNRLDSNGKVTYTNLYLSKVLYGNKTPYAGFGRPFPNTGDFLFATVFDYGEYGEAAPDTEESEWGFRADAFSDYRAGFEIRTTRLCKRVLLFHRFKATEYNGLVRSIDFEYESDTGITFLKKITACGYAKSGAGYSRKKLPSIEFAYQKHDWKGEVRELDPAQFVHSPTGLSSPYRFVDLYNEGLSGILSEQAAGWFYKHNLGSGKFSHAKLVTPRPSFTGLGDQLQITDLDADGGRQLASFTSEQSGYFELGDDDGWRPFKSFDDLPSIDFGDPNARMLDLNGDGRADIMVADENSFNFYLSEGRKGYLPLQKALKNYDDEDSPQVVFRDAVETVFLADMSGDGLGDIVRIRNSEVCYWPNLGYGRFGAKITMDDSPIFDAPDAFNPAHLRLADIDGSGTTDVIYLGKGRFSCWLNLNGNSFAKRPFEIEAFPRIDGTAEVTVTDLLGNGVSCVVWSSPVPANAHRPLFYVDLMNSKKPHLITSYKNNMGKEVEFQYTPSTKFYLEDKANGRPWVTKLHFPVHCVSRTITTDKISGYRFESCYKYHHGYFDHSEREFRGFGMVEQTDSESFEHWEAAAAANLTEKDLNQEPVISRSWHHTGAFMGRGQMLGQFAHEYWYAESARQGFPVTQREVALTDARVVAAPGLAASMIDEMDPQEWREALRACKGMSLRSEVFAIDASRNGNTLDARKKELIPYSVSAKNCVIELIQPKGDNRHAVFAVKESEAITWNYERNADDPRISHNLNIKLDKFGNVLESASVVYPRMVPDNSLPQETKRAQQTAVIIYTRNEFTNAVDDGVSYHLPLPSELKTYELNSVPKRGAVYELTDFDASLFDERPSDDDNILSDARSDAAEYHEIDKALTPGLARRRLIEHVRTVYLSNDLRTALPLHQLAAPFLAFESYQLAYTPQLLDHIFGTKVSAALIGSDGKFTHSEGDGNWWVRSGTIQFLKANETLQDARGRFFTPVSYTDPYGAITTVEYYQPYFLFVEKTQDALGNIAEVDRFDFRTLAPRRLRDINANLSEAISDELGMVKAVAVMGKGNEADNLSGFAEVTGTADGTLIAGFFAATDSTVLASNAKTLLGPATTRFVYDLDAYQREGQPAVAASIVREKHYANDPDSNVQIAFEYSNGLGQVVMKKVQAEPGKAKSVTVNPDDTYSVNVVDTAALTPRRLRWLGTGRTVLNNKGNPVKQFEPYFSVTPRYEDHKELVESGVTPLMHYDPLGRLIRTDMPDGTFAKVEFDSWKQTVYDANDTVEESKWYADRSRRLIDAKLAGEGKDPVKEKTAADKAAVHANTPNKLHFDTLGRPVLSIEHNRSAATGPDEFYRTRVELDTEGNLRKVTDARGNVVMEYQYNMLGSAVYQKSMDAGQRWLLANIVGNPLRTWDERGHEYQYFYDILHRPTHSKVTSGDGVAPLDHIFDRLIYGEDLLSAGRANEAALQVDNVLGKAVKHYDTGGLVDTPRYNFKGQPLAATRRLFRKYKEVANWRDANLTADLESDRFTFTTETDALGRITRQVAPDGSIILPSYNEAGMLDSEKVLLAGSTAETEYIKDIDYNEKGQRNKIIYGNGVVSKFSYDAMTFRLKRVESKRQNGDSLQDWRYTFDAVGNVTHIEDKNIPIVFFDNQKITGVAEYTYDSLYRLISSSGRENDSAMTFGPKDNWSDEPFMKALSPGDPVALRNYTQSYQYDSVGNILEMRHQSNGTSWTRNYSYETANNRLINTTLGADTYTYDHHPEHGFIRNMPHLVELGWNFKEELVKTIRQRVTSGGTPETTYYQYDGQGQRIRKVTENAAAPAATPSKKNERIYVAGYEVYREASGANAGLQRTSLSLMDAGHRFVTIETRNNINDGTEKQLTRYQMHNHLGSASLEMDATARIISYEEFHPYGTTAYQAKNSAIKSAAKRYRYTGMERDEETGLEYHSARYYIPWLGRWLSADPAGIVDGTNFYSYATNSPVSSVDKAGLQSTAVGLMADLRDRGKSVAGGLYGAGKSLAGGFISAFKVGYYSMGYDMYVITGDPVYREQAKAAEEGFQSLRNLANADILDVGKAFVQSRGDAFMAASDKGDYFGASEVAGETLMDLFLLADSFRGMTPRIDRQLEPGMVFETVGDVTSGGMSVAMTGPRNLELGLYVMASQVDKSKNEAKAKDSEKLNELISYKDGNSVVEREGQYWHIPEGMSGKVFKAIQKLDAVGDSLQNAAYWLREQWAKKRPFTEAEINAIREARKAGDEKLAGLLVAQSRGRWIEAQLRKLFPGLEWSGEGPDAFDPKTGISYEVQSLTESNLKTHAVREGMTDQLWRVIGF